MELHDGTKIEAARLVDELNIAMKWLSYRGRGNGTASAADVDYASPAGSTRR